MSGFRAAPTVLIMLVNDPHARKLEKPVRLFTAGAPPSPTIISQMAELGFHLDHDVSPSPGMRVVQMTPPGSECSVVVGEGMPPGEPGSSKGPQLVVDDIDGVRAGLAERGVPIS